MLMILEPVELGEGESFWSCDLRTGVLEGNVSSAEPEALYFLRVRMDAREFLAPIALGPEGRFRCSLAPAGPGEIVRFDPSLPLEAQSARRLGTVTVEVGRTTTIGL
jgi:hypothetical protein